MSKQTAPFTLTIGRRRYPVASLAEASRLYRETGEEFVFINDCRVSDFPKGTVRDREGRVVGTVSWNGRIWDREWHEGLQPIYCPAAEREALQH